MTEHRVGKIFVELDLDPQRYLRKQRTLLKEAQQASGTLEKSFYNLGIKSGATFDLMRAQAIKSFEAIKNSGKATADDLIKAERAKAEKIKRINEEQYGRHVSLTEKMKKNWMGLGSVMVAVYSATRLLRSMEQFVEAHEKQRKAVAGMETAMRSMGRYTPQLSKDMQDYASQLQQVSNFGDEVTMSGIKFLLTYRNITDDLMPRSIKAMQDLAALTGGSMTNAANKLGKASMGMTGELRRIGITVDSDTYKLKGYAGLLEEIEKQVGGQAAAMRDPWTQLSNVIGDTKESLGGLISLAFEDYANDMIKLLPQLSKSWQDIADAIKETHRVKLEYLIKTTEAQIKNREMLMFLPGTMAPEFSVGIDDETVKLLEKKLADLKKQLESLNKPQENLKKGNDKINESLEETKKKLTEIEKLEKKILEDAEAVGDAFLKDYGAGTWEMMQEQLKMMEEQTANETKSREKAAQEAEAITEKQLEEQEKAYEHFYERVEDFASDTFYDIFKGNIDSFSDMLSSMKDLFLRWLAQLAATAAARPITVAISSAMGSLGLGSLFGLPGAGSAAAGLGNLSGLGSISNMASSIPGLSAIGGFLNTPMWGISGSSAGGTYSVGSGFLGQGLAPTWGSMLGSAGLSMLGYQMLGPMLGLPQGKYSGIGAGIGGAAGSIFGPIGTAAGATLGGWLGSMFGGKGHRPHMGASVSLGYGSEGFYGMGGYGYTPYGGAEDYAYGKLRGKGNVNAERDALDAAIAELVNASTSQVNSVIDQIEAWGIDVDESLLKQFKFTFNQSYHGKNVDDFMEQALKNIGQGLDNWSTGILKSLQASINQVTREQLILQIGGAEAPLDLQLKAINIQFDQYETQLKSLNATVEELTWLENQRTKALEQVTQAVENNITAWEGIVKSLQEQIHNLKIGAMSPLSLTEQMELTRGAISNIYGGESMTPDDVSKLQGLYMDMLTIGKELYTPVETGQIWRDESIIESQYDKLFNETILALENLEEYADIMMSEYDVQIQQLAYLEMIAANTTVGGSYQHGTDYVPRDMIARVHQGERIIPAHENISDNLTITIPINIDGNQIGYVVAKQSRTNPELISAIRSIN